MNNPGCNRAKRLCCWAGVIASGFMAAKAAREDVAADDALLGRRPPPGTPG